MTPHKSKKRKGQQLKKRKKKYADMQPSNDALVVWASQFRNPRSSLEFGGEGAVMQASQRLVNALDELVAGEYVTAANHERIPGRVQYRATGKCALGALKKRVAKHGGDTFAWIDEHGRWPLFEKRGA